MRRTHYLRERGKLESRAKELRSELEQLDRRMAALDVVWNEIFNDVAGNKPPSDLSVGDSNASDIVGSGDVTEEKGTRPNGLLSKSASLGKAIDSALSLISGEFGVKDIEAAVVSMYPELIVDRTTIAGRLRKLTAENKLQLVVQGSGRRAGLFKKSPPLLSKIG